MPWFYVDDGFSDSKPVLNMPARHRLAACGLWVLAGSWSAKEETDGRVPEAKLKQLGARPALIDVLTTESEFGTPLWSRVGREVTFNSWAKWQKTRAENEARRQRESEKKATWRAAKKGRNYVATSGDTGVSTGDNMVDSEGNEMGVSTGDTPGVSTGESLYPDPTRPDPSTSIETFSGEVTKVDAREPRPTCPRHPLENAKNERCPDCRRRREWDESEAARVKADQLTERRNRRTAIDNCGLCDQNGKRENRIGHLTDCDHPDTRVEVS